MYRDKDIFYCDIELTTEQQFEIQALSFTLQSASKEQLIDLLLMNTKTLLLNHNRIQKMMADILKNRF